MWRQFLAVLAVACGLSGAALADDPVAQLARIDHFAFGGIGAAGTTSPGELAFRGVMGRATKRDDFLAAAGDRHTSGGMLCAGGLRTLDRPVFGEKAKTLAQDKAEVETIKGCMPEKTTLAAAVESIRKGHYDYAAANPRQEPW